MHPNNPTDISQAGLDLITRAEGRKLRAYLCPANRLTIGVGHVLLPRQDYALFPNTDPSRLARLKRECEGRRKIVDEARTILHINDEQLDTLLENDTRQIALFLRSVTPVELSQNQFDALCSFIFNVGQGNYAASTLRKRLHAGDYAGAAAQFDRWIKSTVNGKKIRLPGLVARRADERALFEQEG